MNSYLITCKILNELSIKLPKVGDEVLFGKWKNRRAIIKKFKKDKNNQIILITDKGIIPLFHVRLAKLMKESYVPETDQYFIELWDKIKALDISEEVRDGIKDSISRTSNRIAKRYIGEIDGVKIALVNGKEVKQKIDMDFTEGSNGAAKKYCPYNEVWLDAKYDISLLKGILFHELSERYLMTTKGYIYDDAHDFANSVEHQIMSKV